MIQSASKIYNNIVSFGCMCSTALYLKKIGVRSSSCFFDWLTSDLKHNMELVDSGFKDFFETKYFKQEFPGYSHLITNTKYNFVYTHVFNPKETMKKQYKRVKKHIQKSIDNFIKSINDNCLLIYYSRSKEECEWIKHNESAIHDFCSRHNCDMTFVLNFDIGNNFQFKKIVIPQNNIHKPNGGGVSYPFECTEELDSFLISHYDENKRLKNINFKSHRSIIGALKHKLQSKKKDRLVV